MDGKEYGWLKESAAVNDLWKGNILQLRTLAQDLLPKMKFDTPPDPETRARWQRRYEAGRMRLQKAGIKTTMAGVEEYISLRTQWDRYVTALAPKFAYELDEIDSALAKVK